MALDREKVLVTAQKLVDKKKYDKAVVEYQKVIEEDPKDARTLLKIGDLQTKMELYADAVATYERVGRFYASQGFALKAIAVYKQIREIIAKHIPRLEDSYAHLTPKLAELYQQLGLTSDAVTALDEVATRLQRQNRDQEAIEICKKIVELDFNNPLPHLRLAEAFSRGKEIDSAVAEFGMAAGQLIRMRRVDDALKVLDRLLHHKLEPTYARIAAEQLLARGGPNDGMQALAKLQVAFQANAAAQRDLDSLGLLARAFTAIGQEAKAIEVQKEMARAARDSGSKELFGEILARLQKLVPNDEVVKQLASGSQALEPISGRPTSEAQASTAPISVAEEAYEEVVEGEVETQSSIPPAEVDPEGELVVDSDVEVAEEMRADEVREDTTASLGAGQALRSLDEAAAYRRRGEVGKAIEALRIGIEVDPRSVPLREAMRDVLFEAGRSVEALPDMLDLATLQLDALDGDGAARTLQNVLALDPGNARAVEMMSQLGYEIGDEPPTKRAHLEPMLGEYATYDPEAPLPAYDLEDTAPSDEPVAGLPFSAPTTWAMSPAGIEGMDDPFGDAPLPSFPLDPTGEAEVGLLPADSPSGPIFDLVPAAARRASSEPPRSAGGKTAELESALEEAEFFASRGLYDDARTILEEQLSRLPSNPLLLERLAELEVQERVVVGASGTRPTPAGAVEDRSFRIAESLGALDGGDRASGVGPGVGHGPGFVATSEQVDVEEVFAKFKEGVAKQIDVDDGQGHYDLGIAYKEMGLVDDALREFETAAMDPKRACICLSTIGMIQIERGNLNEAIEAFMRGLKAPGKSKEQVAALTFDIGAAYEEKKMAKLALDCFQRTARLIPSFRDVQERIRRLQRTEPKQPVRAAAVGADDEFDRAFDDILGRGKLP